MDYGLSVTRFPGSREKVSILRVVFLGLIYLSPLCLTAHFLLKRFAVDLI